MIVGSMQVDTKELRKYIGSVEDFTAFAESLVPIEYRHIKEIINNQVYYNLLILRKTESIRWQVKKEIIEAIAEGVWLTGLVNVVFDIETLEHCVNKDRIQKFYDMEG